MTSCVEFCVFVSVYSNPPLIRTPQAFAMKRLPYKRGNLFWGEISIVFYDLRNLV